MKTKLAQALLRRKELQKKVDQLATINRSDLYEPVVQRIKVTDSIDNVTANVPKLTAAQVTHEFDTYARALRMVDAAIQQANWTVEVELPEETLASYSDLFPSSLQPAPAPAAKPRAVRKKTAARRKTADSAV